MESVSVSLLIQNNKYQSNKIIQFTTQYTSKIYEFRSSVFSYLKLKKTNDILAKENARLNTIISQKKAMIQKQLMMIKNIIIYQQK